MPGEDEQAAHLPVHDRRVHVCQLHADPLQHHDRPICVYEPYFRMQLVIEYRGGSLQNI